MQNEEMLKLVSQVEAEEAERKAILSECKNEEEQFKLRQKFIEKKAESQKKVKMLMGRHKKEAEYLDKEETNQKLKESKLLKEGKDDAEAEEGEEEEAGNEEQEGDGEKEPGEDF